MRSRFSLWLTAAYAVGVALLLVPVVRTLLDPASGGMILFGGDDESSYFARVQESLMHPLSFVHSPNGMWGGPTGTPTLQMARIEHIVGLLFSWTGLYGPLLGFIVMAVCAPLLMPAVALLSRKCGASERVALVAGVFSFWILRYLGRPFHPSVSMPLTVFALALLWRWWERPTMLIALATGALGGFLTGVYLWSWTYFWAVSGLLVCAALLPGTPERMGRIRTMPVLIGAAFIGLIPEILRLSMLWRHPDYADSAERVGFLPSHMLESLPRSALLLVLCVSMWAVVWRQKKVLALAPYLAMLTAALVCLNQQVIHGKVISFSTHYYPYICLVAILSIVVVAIGRRVDAWGGLAVVTSVIFLGGAFHDYGGRLQPLLKPDLSWSNLVPAVRLLREGATPEIVLSDGYTSAAIAGATDDDVVFMPYGNKIVVSTREYLERYCLSGYAFDGRAESAREIAQYMKELTRPARERIEALYGRHLALAQETCTAVAADIPGMLARYGVTMLLWNERLHPEWKIPVGFTLERRGEGWSIWRPTPA